MNSNSKSVERVPATACAYCSVSLKGKFPADAIIYRFPAIRGEDEMLIPIANVLSGIFLPARHHGYEDTLHSLLSDLRFCVPCSNDFLKMYEPFGDFLMNSAEKSPLSVALRKISNASEEIGSHDDTIKIEDEKNDSEMNDNSVDENPDAPDTSITCPVTSSENDSLEVDEDKEHLQQDTGIRSHPKIQCIVRECKVKLTKCKVKWTKLKMKLHLKKCHANMVQTEITYRNSGHCRMIFCDYCYASVKSTDFQKHCKNVHGCYVCPSCKKGYASALQRDEHRMVKHDITLSTKKRNKRLNNTEAQSPISVAQEKISNALKKEIGSHDDTIKIEDEQNDTEMNDHSVDKNPDAPDSSITCLVTGSKNDSVEVDEDEEHLQQETEIAPESKCKNPNVELVQCIVRECKVKLTKLKMKRHFKKCHANMAQTKITYRNSGHGRMIFCNYCSASVKSTDFQKHCKRIHGCYVCPYCKEGHASASQRDEHRRMTHGIILPTKKRKADIISENK